MAGVQLRDYQHDALEKMRNGCILNGGVGVGKSRTALAYYYILNGGEVNTPEYVKMKAKPKDLYIITTALKRDKFEWELELLNFRMSVEPSESNYRHKIVVDSWNNIKNYLDVKDAFFIFDEQRVIGYGAWAKTFLKITKQNLWILLTATPGDTWADYMTVFIANGWYKNKTDFERKHAVWSRYTKYPKVEKWINEGRLIQLRNYILIEMEMIRTTVQHHEHITVEYDRLLYADTATKRWNPFLNQPIETASEFCYVLRKIVNSDKSRLYALIDILKTKPKAIIFYNFDYELELLRKLFGDTRRITEKNEFRQDSITKEDIPWLHLVDERVAKAEWNGHLHEDIPVGDYWVYLVQYAAGAEGWNCVTTDTIIFYSQNYSYRTVLQASGRTDRMNTPFTDLYYFHFRSNSKIDLAIRDAQKRKKKFNEKNFSPIFDETQIMHTSL